MFVYVKHMSIAVLPILPVLCGTEVTVTATLFTTAVLGGTVTFTVDGLPAGCPPQTVPASILVQTVTCVFVAPTTATTVPINVVGTLTLTGGIPGGTSTVPLVVVCPIIISTNAVCGRPLTVSDDLTAYLTALGVNLSLIHI